jgi:hypothetical protein
MNRYLIYSYIILLSLIFIGCSSNSVRQLSEEEVKEIAERKKQYELDELARKEKVFSALSKQDRLAQDYVISLGYEDKLNPYSVIWIQPKNKSEECRLFFGRDPKELDVFWDGGCKDGYAYGLGREFLKGISADSITDAEEGSKSLFI